jgi:hypothetical protein
MVLEIQAPLRCITTSVALLQAVEPPPETMQLDFIQRQGLLALQAMVLPRQLDCTYRREPQVFLVNQANQQLGYTLLRDRVLQTEAEVSRH